jgi:citrate lyase subunit beta/citryl-CoA lyase
MRSLLYIPGNHPGMLQNCAIYGSDAVIFDLEDAISISEKDSARKLVKHALKGFDYGNIGVIVRVNGRDTSYFEADLEEIVPANPDAIRLPKVDSAEDVLAADELISRLEEANGLPRGRIGIQAMLETARAIVNVNSIAAAIAATRWTDARRTGPGGRPWNTRHKRGLRAALRKERRGHRGKSARAAAFDTVFTDVNDAEGLREQAAVGFALGFSGKAAIHPSQIPVINAVYTPEPNEVAKAAKIVAAAKEAERRGLA